MSAQTQLTGNGAGRRLKPSEAFARMTQPAPLANAAADRGAIVRFGYRVGSLGFLVGAGVLSELLSAPEIYPIPNVHSAIRGYVNVQGTLVPVWDMRTLLDDSERGEREAVLVLGRGDHRVGVLIDGLPRALKKIERASQPPPLPESLQSYATQALFADGALWFEFDHEGFFRTQTERLAA